jgi:GNAT superfamily N-acetyltransferase
MGRNNADFQGGQGLPSDHVINYIPHEDRDGNKMHAWQMRDSHGNLLGHLNINHWGAIEQIETHPEFRRQGIATALYNAAKDANRHDPSIPAPVHSSARTPSGNAWAKSVSKAEGKELKPLQSHNRVSPKTYDMRGAMWEMKLPLNRG